MVIELPWEIDFRTQVFIKYILIFHHIQYVIVIKGALALFLTKCAA